MHILKYQRFPNNEVRVTHYYKAPPKNVNEEVAATSNVTSNSSCASAPEDEAPTECPSSLTLGEISASGDSNLPFRKTKFGLNAKNTLLRIGGAYDTLSVEPSDFVFLTGTLPGNTPAAFRAIAEYSSYIAESIGKWLQRTVKCEHYFYVWELQKRGALHFHYCAHISDRALREKAINSFKAKWTSLLDDVSTRSGVCLWEGDKGTCWLDRYGTLQAYAQPVHTSVAAYLSGYFGNEKDKHKQDKDSPYYPKRWWGASRKSTNLLRDLTDTLVVEHPNYRGARYEMQAHYEAVLHDTPHAHHYSHKVGVGSTCVSYHPEDKGTEIWQGLQKQMLQHKTHPNIYSLIQLVRKLMVYLQPYVAGSKSSATRAPKRVLQDLQDLTLISSLQRGCLRDTHLSILRMARSYLPSPSGAKLHLRECYRLLTLYDTWMEMNSHQMQWNRYGWLANPTDVSGTVDMTVELSYFSTTDPDGADAQEGAAHGSLSPQNSLHSQLTIFDK